jgi:hypothetical protein
VVEKKRPSADYAPDGNTTDGQQASTMQNSKELALQPYGQSVSDTQGLTQPTGEKPGRPGFGDSQMSNNTKEGQASHLNKTPNITEIADLDKGNHLARSENMKSRSQVRIPATVDTDDKMEVLGGQEQVRHYDTFRNQAGHGMDIMGRGDDKDKSPHLRSVAPQTSEGRNTIKSKEDLPDQRASVNTK